MPSFGGIFYIKCEGGRMSNLGLYKWFTTTAKKVGGAGNLIGIFIGSGVW